MGNRWRGDGDRTGWGWVIQLLGICDLQLLVAVWVCWR